VKMRQQILEPSTFSLGQARAQMLQKFRRIQDHLESRLGNVRHTEWTLSTKEISPRQRKKFEAPLQTVKAGEQNDRTRSERNACGFRMVEAPFMCSKDRGYKESKGA
ncbi:hypothetical protein HHI36_020189, partial [Cryptolaemus montrouzieri]